MYSATAPMPSCPKEQSTVGKDPTSPNAKGIGFSAKKISCGEKPVALETEWFIAAYTNGTMLPHWSLGRPVIAFFTKFLANLTMFSAIPFVQGENGVVDTTCTPSNFIVLANSPANSDP